MLVRTTDECNDKGTGRIVRVGCGDDNYRGWEVDGDGQTALLDEHWVLMRAMRVEYGLQMCSCCKSEIRRYLSGVVVVE